MKINLGLILLVLIAYVSNAQSITLTFQGKDASQQTNIDLDRVLVENLTLACDTMIYGPLPVLALPPTTGLNANSIDGGLPLQISQNGPNPFIDNTSLTIRIQKRSGLRLRISDMTGKILAQYENEFSAGNHMFEISANGSGLMLLSVFAENNFKTVKLLCNPTGNVGNSIKYLGGSKEKFKSTASDINLGFQYNSGNQLLYTVMKNGFTDIRIFDSPHKDTTYICNMTYVGNLATVVTAQVNYMQNSATAGGNVTSDGGLAVTHRGVCWSKNLHPSISDSHTSDGAGLGTFVSNIQGLSPGTIYYVRAYATNDAGTAYGNEVSFTTASWLCGASLTINHVAGNTAPVTKTVTYGTVSNIPGEPAKCWMTANLGADHQATAYNDATEASAGWYWQFNRKQGYMHDGAMRFPDNAWNNNIIENANWQPANDPCALEIGNGWRLPTSSEWQAVDFWGSWTNWNGPWNSDLKLHAAGELSLGFGDLQNRGTGGNYWSSDQESETHGKSLSFGAGVSGGSVYSKDFGFTVRCVKD